MPIDSAYASPEDYRLVTGHHSDQDDPKIELDLQFISRMVENITGQFFTKDASAVARTFWPKGPPKTRRRARSLNWAESENPYLYGHYVRELVVPPMSAAPTSIKIDEDRDGLFTDETALVSTDYQLLPLNATKGPEVRPYTSIYIPDWSTKGGFSEERMVEVTAAWGWPSIPRGIVQYTCELCGILRMDSPRATRTVDEFNRVTGLTQQATNILNELRDTYNRRYGIGGGYR